MNLSDIAMEVFAMESSLLRRRSWHCLARAKTPSTSVLYTCAMRLARIEAFSRTVLSACCEGDVLRKHLATVHGMRITCR